MQSGRYGRTSVEKFFISAALLALLLMASLAPIGASQGPEPPAIEWGDDYQLSDSREISDDPVVAVTREGGALIAWRERVIARYAVYFSVLDARGSTVLERTQLGADIPSSMDPDVAVDGRGRLIFVWTGQDDQELYYARADPEGVLEAGPTRVTNATGDSAEASIWVDSRDHVHVMWFDARSGRTELYYMQLDPSGRKVVEDRALQRVGTEQEVDIAMDQRGDIHVSWNAIAPAGQIQWNSELHYAKLSGAGEPLVEDRLVATSRGTIGYPDLALDLGGHVHLVWSEGTSVRERVLYAELDGSGRTLEGPVEVAGATADPARDIAVAVDGNDRVQVVWSQGVAGASDIWWRALAAGGEPLGNATRLTDARGGGRDPQLALSPRGEPRVVWYDTRTGNAEVYLKVGNRPSAGVDLAVMSDGVSFDPSSPAAGEPVNVSVEVRSEGDTASPPSTLAVRLDGAIVRSVSVPGIPVGGSTTVEASLGTPAMGEHTVVVEVDPDGLLEEADETNNVAQRLLVVHEPGLLVADAGPDQAAEVGSVVYLDATGTVYRGAGVLSYEWDFGDGSEAGSGLYVDHVYSAPGAFSVTLTVSDGTTEDTDRCRVTVAARNDPPHAIIAPGGPHAVDRLTPLVLSASSSTDDDPSWPSGATIEWDMGDGTTRDGADVAHTYTRLGLFVVTLTVTDAAGKLDINRTTVEVVNLPPVVTLSEVTLEVSVGEEVTLTVEASDPDGTVVEVWWDADASDGVSPQATGATLKHSFDRAGTYNVTCGVRDSDGGQSLVHAQVLVEEAKDQSQVPGPIATLAVLAFAASASCGRRLRSPQRRLSR